MRPETTGAGTTLSVGVECDAGHQTQDSGLRTQDCDASTASEASYCRLRSWIVKTIPAIASAARRASNTNVVPGRTQAGASSDGGGRNTMAVPVPTVK